MIELVRLAVTAPAPQRVRRAGLWDYERALARANLLPVAGVDEAGRGACAGPLVVAAVVLPASWATTAHQRMAGLADSKLLSPTQRELAYERIVALAQAWSVVVIPPEQVDSQGLHRMNVEGMRRALAQLAVPPRYVLLDGFPVGGLSAPSLAVWKGDRVSASVAAASVVAKVTRDRLMCQLHDQFPAYDFATHKGYCTATHQRALREYGPCSEHRVSYSNVRKALSDLKEMESA